MPNKDFYKFFYCDTQRAEALAFQNETGWDMMWASDYQGLNGDTYVVYRNVTDLPEWLQAYATEYAKTGRKH